MATSHGGGRSGMTRKPALALALAALFTATAIQADSYRWVDDEGNVHYSDRVPAEAADRDRDVINQRGMITRRIEGSQSAQQQVSDVASNNERQARRDRMIRESYVSEQDIINARDQRLEGLESIINLARDRVHVLQDRLDELEQRRDEQESAGRTISHNLREQIRVTRDGLEDNLRFIEEREQELMETREGYQADLERFRELSEKGKI